MTTDELTAYREALLKIEEGSGRYSRDPLEHCSNTVEDMRRIASDVLIRFQDRHDEEAE